MTYYAINRIWKQAVSVGFFFMTLLILSGCQEEQNQSIVGQWEAIALSEEDKPLNVELEEITFSFSENEIYTYTSSLNYREAGNFYLKKNLLYTTDTLNKASTEKVVELAKISTDTLVIRMEELGKERLLTLAKVN